MGGCGRRPRSRRWRERSAPESGSGRSASAWPRGLLTVGVVLGVPGEPKAEPPAKEMPAKPAAKKAAPADESPKGEQITFAGRVVDPDGKPVRGPGLFWWISRSTEDDPPALKPAAASAADGRFPFDIDRPLKVHFRSRTLVAAAEGFGLGLLPVKETGAADAEVRLFPDLPVRGRVLDLEGKPVAGATVRVVGVGGQPTARPDAVDEGGRDRAGGEAGV